MSELLFKFAAEVDHQKLVYACVSLEDMNHSEKGNGLLIVSGINLARPHDCNFTTDNVILVFLCTGSIFISRQSFVK